MHLLNMLSLKTINKIVQSGNIAHPLTLLIVRFVYRSFVFRFVRSLN
jgi:hypothetical protein